jgi:hypothetical protein
MGKCVPNSVVEDGCKGTKISRGRRRSVLMTDSSGKATSNAGVLTQPDGDGVYHPICYESHKITAAEQAYPAHVLEWLAMDGVFAYSARQL